MICHHLLVSTQDGLQSRVLSQRENDDSTSTWAEVSIYGLCFPKLLLVISQHDYMKQRKISKPNTFAYSSWFQNIPQNGDLVLEHSKEWKCPFFGAREAQPQFTCDLSCAYHVIFHFLLHFPVILICICIFPLFFHVYSA